MASQVTQPDSAPALQTSWDYNTSMILTELHHSILYTLAYSLQFGFPLTEDEVNTRLLARLDEELVFFNKIPASSEITTSIKQLVAVGLVERVGAFLTLPGHESAVSIRQRRQANATRRQPELERFTKLVSSMPWIKAVLVTGSTAMSNAKLEEDFDFMIVTQAHRLWLARLVVAGLTLVLGKRRSRDREGYQTWCLNLWLEETETKVFSERQSVYTAYELVQARLLLNREQTYEQLVADNSWVESYLPRAGFSNKVVPKEKKAPVRQRLYLWYVIADGWWRTANWLLYHLQLCYMWPHMTREVVTPTIAFFHPRNTQEWAVQGWVAVLNRTAEFLGRKTL